MERNKTKKIIIKNVKKAPTTDGLMNKKDEVVPSSTPKAPNHSSMPEGKHSLDLSDIMKMPKTQVNLELPKLPAKKRWFVLYRRMLTRAKPAATATHHQVHTEIGKYTSLEKKM